MKRKINLQIFPQSQLLEDRQINLKFARNNYKQIHPLPFHITS